MVEDHQFEDQSAVLVTFDTGSISVSSIELAAAIAASEQTRLHGLFVENQDLLRIASLPFTREISFITAEETPTDFDRMQRSLRAMASLFKSTLQQSAQSLQIPWSFDYVSSHSQDTGLVSRAGFSYTIVGHRISTRVRSQQYRSKSRILLIEEHSEKLVHALNVVLQGFVKNNVDLTIVKSDHLDSTQQSELHDFLDHLELRVSRVELKRDQLFSVLTQTGSSYDYVMLSAHENVGNLREILKYLQCPVILVS